MYSELVYHHAYDFEFTFKIIQLFLCKYCYLCTSYMYIKQPFYYQIFVSYYDTTYYVYGKLFFSEFVFYLAGL